MKEPFDFDGAIQKIVTAAQDTCLGSGSELTETWLKIDAAVAELRAENKMLRECAAGREE